MTETTQGRLQFIFTADGFYCDTQDQLSDTDQALQTQFEADRWTALYRLGLTERPERAGPSAAFLYLLSDAFFKSLTSLPDLELLRENAQAPLSETDRLLRAVPFVMGAEYIDKIGRAHV